MSTDWTPWLARWTEAGLIDADTAARIRAFEGVRAGSARLRWPILIALAFGGLMLGGGVLLFVAAHWDTLSPSQRFAIVLAMVGGFHLAGALIADRFHGMSVTLHAIGTVALGGGIALAGQIFNLDEHWPGGIMMWAAGAAVAWAILRQTPQLCLVALLGPAWLAGEWSVATRNVSDVRAARVLAAGMTLLALAYFTTPRRGHDAGPRRALLWLGAIALLPSALFLGLAAWPRGWYRETEISPALHLVGWGVAVLVPLVVAYTFRGTAAWFNAVAALWIGVLMGISALEGEVTQHAWWAVGSIGVVAWGVREGRSERVNMGAALFAGTVLFFYFSEVMDKLGRSASLVGLGLLFLGGGWALERVRRRLVEQTRGAR